jgi:hypothetical protein
VFSLLFVVVLRTASFLLGGSVEYASHCYPMMSQTNTAPTETETGVSSLSDSSTSSAVSLSSVVSQKTARPVSDVRALAAIEDLCAQFLNALQEGELLDLQIPKLTINDITVEDDFDEILGNNTTIKSLLSSRSSRSYAQIFSLMSQVHGLITSKLNLASLFMLNSERCCKYLSRSEDSKPTGRVLH